jgi:uncharacterized membrane protein
MIVKNNEFKIKSTIFSAWDVLKLNWKFLAKIFLVSFGLQLGLSAITNFLEAMQKSGNIGNLILFGFWQFGFVLISIYISLVIQIGLVKTILGVIRKEKGLSWKNIFPKITIKYLLRFSLLSVLYGIIVFFGTLLFIIPGIYLAIKYHFAETLFIDKDISIKEAFNQSAQITQGVKGKIALFGIALFGINVLGLLAIVVGLFVTIPLSVLANFILYTCLLGRLKNEPQNS